MKRKADSKRESDDWTSRIRASSHDVVLAGLASLKRAYKADDKRAQADFRTLVDEGRRLEPELHDVVRKVWSELKSKPGQIMELGQKGRLKSVFDERVASVLVRLGVPSREEIAELSAKVDRLLARERTVPRRRRAASRAAKGQTTRRRPARG